MRFSLMSYEMPEVSGPKYGCFAKIPRHPPEIKKGLLANVSNYHRLTIDKASIKKENYWSKQF